MSIGGGQNLGGAQFTVTANTAQFQANLNAAQQSAVQFTANTKQAFGGLGMQMMMVAQLADDMQYGFRAIVNQIPMAGTALASAFGMAADKALMVGAGLGVVAVGINQVIAHWGTLVSAMQSVVFDTPLSELEKLRVKAEEATEAFDELTKKAPKAQSEAARGFEDLSAEKGHEKILAGLSMSMMQRGVVATADERSQLRYATDIANSNPAEARRAREAVRDAQYKRMQVEASKLMGEATMTGEKGDAARARIAAFAGRNPGMFPPELAMDMNLLTKEGKDAAAQRRLELEGGRNNRKAGDEAREKDRKDVDMLNAQGQANQKLAQDRMQQERVWSIQDRQQALHEERAKVAAQPKAFTGDFFDAVHKMQQAGLDQPQVQKLKEIDDRIKKSNDLLKEIARNNARDAIAG
jgi:hypothetical protein